MKRVPALFVRVKLTVNKTMLGTFHHNKSSSSSSSSLSSSSSSSSLNFCRLFGVKCAKCTMSFSKSDLVMKARSNIYHIECFRCIACSRKLTPGDEFALKDQGPLCKVNLYCIYYNMHLGQIDLN